MLSYSKWFDVMGGVKTLSDWELRERIIDFRVDDLILIYILMGSGKKTLVNAFSLIIVGSRKSEVGGRKSEIT